MKKTILPFLSILFIFNLAFINSLTAGEKVENLESLVKFPPTGITNNLIFAKLYLPDSVHGHYRGTRFDWSGNIQSLVYGNHEFFGRWFSGNDRDVHDTITGPAEDFAPLDYADTKPGGRFMKIGVGILSKPDERPYASGGFYPLVNAGKWIVKTESDQIRFIHELKDKNYSCRYEKTVLLKKGKPLLVLVHTLRNTGSRTIETNVYNHNFFFIDKQPVGPGFSVAFPFDIHGEGQGFGELAKIKDNKIVFLRNLKTSETVYCGAIEGFNKSTTDWHIKVENQSIGAGVKISGDKPLMNLVFWACSTTLCPEPYFKIKVKPGEEFRWKIVYDFYTIQK